MEVWNSLMVRVDSAILTINQNKHVVRVPKEKGGIAIFFSDDYIPRSDQIIFTVKPNKLR